MGEEGAVATPRWSPRTRELLGLRIRLPENARSDIGKDEAEPLNKFWRHFCCHPHRRPLVRQSVPGS